MTEQEQLTILKQGAGAWNKWREKHRSMRVDLRGANLSSADLRGADLSSADLRGAHLKGAYLSRAYLSEAILRGANLTEARLSRAYLSRANLSSAGLRGADLSEANLSEANLREANLSRADLSEAILRRANLRGANLSSADLRGANLSSSDLSEANLIGVNLSGANLSEANLSGANLSGANLSEAKVAKTVFGGLDLRNVKGLETIQHSWPSYLSIDTIYLSNGDIPEVFLRGTGAPDSFIEYMHALVRKPFDYYSCFISYSSKDQAFAERLYNDLQGKGVRCWYAKKELKPGDFYRDIIDESIKIYDKVVLILSEDSIKSNWVKEEVERAWRREGEPTEPGDPWVLFPIMLDDTIMKTERRWAANLRYLRHIGDFTRWKDHDAYQAHFQQLLHDLKQKRPETKL